MTPPHDFICPITCDIFVDPVIVSDGKTYERSAIQEWMRHSKTSPLTRESLVENKFFPNISLKHSIVHWQNDIKKKNQHIIVMSPLQQAQAQEQPQQTQEQTQQPQEQHTHTQEQDQAQQPQIQEQEQTRVFCFSNTVIFTFLSLFGILLIWIIITAIVMSNP